MVVAKNKQSFDFLKNQFANRKVIKKYLALVHGYIKEKKGTITKSISLSKKDRRKRSALLDKKSKSSWTEYKVIQYFSDNNNSASQKYTFLEVNPKTGRTHQIRVHLSSIGHPIAGDKQYKFKRLLPPKNLSRQFLHAYYLKFQTLDGKIREFKSDLPTDLKNTLNKLHLTCIE